jgi:hypothetical protein
MVAPIGNTLLSRCCPIAQALMAAGHSNVSVYHDRTLIGNKVYRNLGLAREYIEGWDDGVNTGISTVTMIEISD